MKNRNSFMGDEARIVKRKSYMVKKYETRLTNDETGIATVYQLTKYNLKKVVY